MNRDGIKTFEELVNRSLQHNDLKNQNSKVLPAKKPFLKRGEGLKRFQNASKPLSNTIVKVQEAKRCIKALNLRNENHDKEPTFARKVLHIQPSCQTKPKTLITNRNNDCVKTTQKVQKPSAQPEMDDEILKRFALLCQTQKELKNNDIKEAQ